MIKIILKNKLSVFGFFSIVIGLIVIGYQVYERQNLDFVNGSAKRVYSEVEKTKGEFKYGKTNLNIVYLYIELESSSARFYLYENVGNNYQSPYLNDVNSKIKAGDKISIWFDRKEIENYEDVEIKKLQIDKKIIGGSSFNITYIIVFMIIGLILLVMSRKFK